jgi:hypothetical protein
MKRLLQNPGDFFLSPRRRSRHLHKLDDVQFTVNPKGILAQSPGLRGTSYPGKSAGPHHNPNGVAADCCTHALRKRIGRNPVGVGDETPTFPRVARPSQPWAGGRNPFGIKLRPHALEMCRYQWRAEREKYAVRQQCAGESSA